MFRNALAIACMFVSFASATYALDRVPRELTPLTAPQIEQLNTVLGGQASDTYDTPPRVLEAFVPIYPASRLLSGKTGSCHVSFSIDVDGRASDASPDPDADEKMCAHALFALQYWRFEPARRSGEAVVVRFRMPFHYDITR